MPNPISLEIAAGAARLVVDEGMDYSAAKRKAARALGRHAVRVSDLPSNERVEDEVREYLALFHARTQPIELAALRRLALVWMRTLAQFRPHLTGAVWRGTATRLSALQLELYCDDPKAAEIALINLNLNYDVAMLANGDEVLSMAVPCAELGERVQLRLAICDHDALRGGLRPDARGRTWRGEASGVERLLVTTAAQSS
jgi:hypothetical protein